MNLDDYSVLDQQGACFMVLGIEIDWRYMAYECILYPKMKVERQLVSCYLMDGSYELDLLISICLIFLGGG